MSLPSATPLRGEPVEFESYFNAARPKLIDLLQGVEPTEALEIGCAAGANLGLLKKRFPRCRTVGIERDTVAGTHGVESGAIDEIRIGDVLDQSVANFAPRRFDLLLMSHVLEHFEDPGLVVQRSLEWLRPGGRILVALPNLRHYSVIVELLLRGDFRYRRDGILDQTHLRFFTRRSAIRFLHAQGLEIVASAPDIEGGRSRLISTASLHLADDFAAFAYNFCLRKADACAS